MFTLSAHKINIAILFTYTVHLYVFCILFNPETEDNVEKHITTSFS